MLRHAIPVLHVNSSAVAEAFYSGLLGFRKRFEYRSDETRPDPCYMAFARDGAWLHVSLFPGDGVSGNVAYVLVDDIDGLYRELSGKDVPISLEPTDQTWGNREMYARDPDGNRIRFGQPLGR